MNIRFSRFPRVSVVSLICLFHLSAMSQSHGNHVMVGMGATYPQGFDATLAYEHEMNLLLSGKTLLNKII